jgi:hypothetical protein
MNKCLFCNQDHDETEECEPYRPEQSPSQARMPALTSVLDQLITITSRSNCDGSCATREPFKLCNGCIAAAAIVQASTILATTLDKINKCKGD